MSTEKIVNQALSLEPVEKKIVEFGIVKNSGKSHLHREGQTNFKKVQVDTLSFMPLAKKVLQVLTGNPSFNFEEIDEDYDEPEADSWSKSNDDTEVFPIDEYSDKVDVIEVTKNNREKIQDAVNQSIIDETRDKPEPSSDNSTVPEPENSGNKE